LIPTFQRAELLAARECAQTASQQGQNPMPPLSSQPFLLRSTTSYRIGST